MHGKPPLLEVSNGSRLFNPRDDVACSLLVATQVVIETDLLHVPASSKEITSRGRQVNAPPSGWGARR